MLGGASAGATEGIIKNSIMLHTGKACTTDSKRAVPDCGLKPQLKECVEHDCYIYAWNSAGTMEGIDTVMVRNSLLINLQCCFECAGGFCLQYWWREVRGLMRLLSAGGFTGRTDRDWNRCGCIEADRRAHRDAGMKVCGDILCVRLTADNLIRHASRHWLFWVKQARQWRFGGRFALYTVTSAGAGSGGRWLRATGCYLYRAGP